MKIVKQFSCGNYSACFYEDGTAAIGYSSRDHREVDILYKRSFYDSAKKQIESDEVFMKQFVSYFNSIPMAVWFCRKWMAENNGKVKEQSMRFTLEELDLIRSALRSYADQLHKDSEQAKELAEKL